jgi:hypothetical protein
MISLANTGGKMSSKEAYLTTHYRNHGGMIVYDEYIIRDQSDGDSDHILSPDRFEQMFKRLIEDVSVDMLTYFKYESVNGETLIFEFDDECGCSVVYGGFPGYLPNWHVANADIELFADNLKSWLDQDFTV